MHTCLVLLPSTTLGFLSAAVHQMVCSALSPTQDLPASPHTHTHNFLILFATYLYPSVDYKIFLKCLKVLCTLETVKHYTSLKLDIIQGEHIKLSILFEHL